jgi:hypothetical protein
VIRLYCADRLAPASAQSAASALPDVAALSPASPRNAPNLGGAREMAQRERELVASLPEGFPKPPPAVSATYEGSDKEGYKAHMKKKLVRDKWENDLDLYRQKELEGDRFGAPSASLSLCLSLCPSV